MSKYFCNGTPLSALEREMMLVPNFSPQGCGRQILGRCCLTAEDVDCRYCLQYGRGRCRSRTCPYLAERLEAGAVTMGELVAETVAVWRHIGLKKRALQLAHQANAFPFTGRLHAVRMTEIAGASKDYADSKWLAAVYLLSAHTDLWIKTANFVWRNQIDFDAVKLDNVSIQDYVLYRSAKGISHGILGVTSEELADSALVDDDTLGLILGAVLIARYGPEVIRLGRVKA